MGPFAYSTHTSSLQSPYILLTDSEHFHYTYRENNGGHERSEGYPLQISESAAFGGCREEREEWAGAKSFLNYPSLSSTSLERSALSGKGSLRLDVVRGRFSRFP